MGGRAAAKALDDVREEVLVPYAPPSAALVRAALTASLAGHAVDPTVVEEARVVVTELVVNSVQHARPAPGEQIHAAWTLRKGVVEIAVTDAGGPTAPVPVRRPPQAGSGRGLRIVRALAHEWGVVDLPRGRTVWASCGGPSRRRTR